MAKATVVVFLFVAAACAATWYASPALLGWLAIRIAPDWDVTNVHLVVGRPTWTGIAIEQAELEIAGWHVTARGVRVSYEPKRLVDGTVDFIAVDALAVRKVQNASAAASAGDVQTSDLMQILTAIPHFEIASAQIVIDEVDFVGEGTAANSADGLQIVLNGIQPRQAERLRLLANAQPAGSVDLQLFDEGRIDDGGGVIPFVSLTSTLDAQNVNVTGQFSLSGYPLRLASEVLDIVQGEGRLSGTVQSALPWPIDLERLIAIPFTGSFELEWAQPELGVTARGIVARVSGTLDSLAIVFAGGSVAMPEQGLALNLLPGMEVTYEGDRVVVPAGVPFTLQPAAELSITGVLGQSVVELGEAVSVASKAQIDAQLDRFRMGAQIDASVVIDGDNAAGQGSLTTGGHVLPFEFKHELASGDGRLSSTSTLVVKAPLIGGVIRKWTEPFDIVGGQIGTVIDVRWSEDAMQGSVASNLSGVDVAVDKDFVRGVDGTLLLSIGEQTELLPSQIRARSADFGVLVEDIGATLAWRDDSLTVKQAVARTLGGRAEVAEIDLNLDTLDADFTVALDGLDLALVLALEGEDIKGTGSLHGTLPIRVRDGTVSMKAGQVAARAPGGKIALSPQLANATGQAAVDFALQALTDFTYEKLDVTADYADNGDLALSVSLLGRNPAVEKGRAIQYNLNINENMKALLDSLRAQREVTDRLERRASGKGSKPEAETQ